MIFEAVPASDTSLHKFHLHHCIYSQFSCGHISVLTISLRSHQYLTAFTPTSLYMYLHPKYGHFSAVTPVSASIQSYMGAFTITQVHLPTNYSHTHPTMQFTTKNEIWMQVKYGNIWSVGVKYISRFTFRSDAFSTMWTSQPHSPASRKRGEEKLCLAADLPRRFCQLPGNPYWLVGSWSTRGRWLQRRSRPRKLVQSVLFSTGQLG